MHSADLRLKHQAGLSSTDYLRTGSPSQNEKWQAIYTQLRLTPAQQQLIASWTRRMNIIALSGLWCGDCIQQGPMLQLIAQANPDKLDLRWLDRDAHKDLQAQVRINGGDRVPVVLFCAEDYELVGWYGDRTLSRYRALAARQLGPSCPLPGAPLPPDEAAATLQDWIDQFERIHLLLRLSTRLRGLHGD